MPAPENRFSFAADLQSRDGGITKGSLLTNCYVDMKEAGGPQLYRRPGLGTGALGGTSVLLGTFTGSLGGGGMAAVTTPSPAPVTDLYAIRQTVLFKVTPPNLPADPATTWNAWDGVVLGGAPNFGVNQGTLGTAVAAFAPIHWTTSGTATTASVRLLGYNDGTRYWIYGSGNPLAVDYKDILNNIQTQPYRLAAGSYNGTVRAATISTLGTMAGIASQELSDIVAGTAGNVVVHGRQASYVYNGTAVTKITDADFPATTVPGMVYLDGTFYVMEPDGTIWNSTAAADDPTTWPTDGFITAEFESDPGVYLGKALNYVVALGQYTVQLFWDAANASGSPLLPVSNGVLLIGCASAGSVAQTESTLIWIAQRKGQGSTANKGRFIAVLVGTSYEVISTDDVSRILDTDTLETVYSCVAEMNGHTWYVLTLVASAITLVYDMQTKKWSVWTFLTLGSQISISSIVQTNGLAVGTTGAAHGWSDGDPVAVSGVTPAGFNGTFNVNVSGTTGFSYPLSTTGTSTGTGASKIGQGFTEGPLKIVAACGMNNMQMVQDASGAVYELSSTLGIDGTAGVPINQKARTANLDNGNLSRKFCHAVAVYGDILAAQAYGLLRYTDDDFQSYSSYRRFDLSENPCHQHRWGYYVRRAWEWRYTGTAMYRQQYLDPDITQGVT